jgi:hypothetical protein
LYRAASALFLHVVPGSLLLQFLPVLLPAAAELVSDVANGGQVLIDEPTFLLVKDSLSLLGTVSEAGYDDRMLQRLNQARVVGRLQQQVACVGCLDV